MYIERENLYQRSKEIVEQATEQVCVILPRLPLRTEIEEAPELTIPELGIAGRFTKSENLLQIWIDSGNQHLREHFEEELTRTFAHEYMHAFREQVIPWEGGTLLASMVSEGLSQSFEMEVLQTHIPPLYATQLSQAELEASWLQAGPVLQATDYDSRAWFFGSEVQGIKRWTAYSLGFWLVQRHMKRSGKKASDLGQEAPEVFLS